MGKAKAKAKAKAKPRKPAKPAKAPAPRGRKLPRAMVPQAASAHDGEVAWGWRTTLPVSDIVIGNRYRKDFGDLQALADSIDARGGLIQAVAVTPDLKLIAGERRIRAWALSKFAAEQIPVRVINIDSIVAGEWDENAPGVRKDFTLSEAVAIAQALRPLEQAKAAERVRSGKAAPAADKGKADDKVARLVGMDRKTLAKAAAVVAAAREDVEKFGALLEQMDRTGRAHGPFKRLTNIVQGEQLRNEPPALPGQGPYRTGVIDLPWASEPNGESPSKTGRGYFNYPTMNTAEAIAFGDKVVPLLHPEGGHFWFWTTNFHLLEGCAFEILDAWSAKAEAAGVGPIKRIGKRTWAKNVAGRGQVFRGQTEDVILCKFGKSAPGLAEVLSTLLTADVREDSEKPEQFYRDVERATPASRYFELFARRKMPDNWDGFGDQVGKLDRSAPAEAPLDNAANAVKGVRGYVAGSGKNKPDGESIAVLIAKVSAGEVQWSAGERDPKAKFGLVAQFARGRFENLPLGTEGEERPPLPGFKAALHLSLKSKSATVDAFTDDAGLTHVGSAMPYAKVSKFLLAWSKAATAPAPLAALVTPAAPVVAEPVLPLDAPAATEQQAAA